MTWQDIGLIFPVKDVSHWAHSHAYLPTPFALSDKIRVFVAFLDEQKMGRVGYIDVSKEEPTQILGVSEGPVLDLGGAGAFDEHGVSPMSVIKVKDKLRMYYIGWQRLSSKKERYRLYTGLAESSNDGERFYRVHEVPILGDQTHQSSLRTIGCVLQSSQRFCAWYAEAVRQVSVNNKYVPSYELRYLVSKDGIDWQGKGQQVFAVKPDIILGYGRSFIWKNNRGFEGLFCPREWQDGYKAIYSANSEDGINWSELMPVFSASDTVDGQSEVCFPGVIFQESRALMFYNGDQFGEAGLRLAIGNYSSSK